MKKFFANSHITKKKVLEFLDKKGFYLVLFLCIAIITATAYVVTKRNLSSYMDSSEFDAISQANKPAAKLADNTPTGSTTANKPSTNKPAAANNNVQAVQPSAGTSSATNNTKQPLNISIEMPVNGDIIKDYAKSSLVYSKTLEQWTTHEGIDIASDRGTPVKAGLDGVIGDIYTDFKYGITIVVDSGNGIKTKYANLSTDSMVKKGAKVKKGDAISGVGNTAVFESGEPSHLHLEVLQNGASVNPKNFIK